MIARLLTIVCAAIAVAMPAIAEACPSCAGREDGGVGRIVVLGIMILLPFAIAGVLYKVIRSANAHSDRYERVP